MGFERQISKSLCGSARRGLSMQTSAANFGAGQPLAKRFNRLIREFRTALRGLVPTELFWMPFDELTYLISQQFARAYQM